MTQINARQWSNLQKAHERGTLAQAYLFCGPDGTGKFDLAVKFIGLVNGIGDEKKMRLGQDPDVFLVEPIVEERAGKSREKEISIEQVKEVFGKIGYFSYHSKFKFLMIKKAQKMTSAAANSLLKLIEEPPSDLVVILVSDNEQRILPTLRSRCQPVRFGLADEEAISGYLGQRFSQLEQSRLDLCVSLSRGRVELAEKLAVDELMQKEMQALVDEFRGALKCGLLKGLELSKNLSTDRQELEQAMDQWAWYLRKFLLDHIKKDGEEKITRKVFLLLRSLARLCHQIKHTNINPRIQLDNYFVQMC